MIHEFNILDSVWTEIHGHTAELLNNHLSFKRKLWGQTYKKGQKTYSQETVYMIESFGHGKYMFPTGLLSRALDGIADFGEQHKVTGSPGDIAYDEPQLDGIIFRDYQERLIRAGIEHGRGVLKAPTATGKSIVILGLMSAFSQENILFLCHTKDLVQQMRRHLEKNGFDDVGEWTGTKKNMGRITVSTIQSYANIADQYIAHWDAVFIDEGHHVSTIEGQYAKALTLTAAPVKLALTATLPYKPEAQMALEAYVGPLIAEYTIEEAGEDGWLAKPNIQILQIPTMDWHMLMDDTDFSGYKDPSEYQIAYWNGIVLNTARNMRICHEADEIQARGETVLINVVRKEHGAILMDIINDNYGFKATFVQGSTKDRESVLEALDKKEIKVVIATKVFNEGVDVPNLNACINAAGGKSEIEVLQKVGRGLRKAEGKTEVTIIDFHDTCHPILENHYWQRYRMYVKNGWMKQAIRKPKKKT